MNREEYKEEEQKNGKIKRRKVKAWCGECFQSFENGPYSKVCKDHLLKGKCNLVGCKKGILVKSHPCVRMFPNTNSENRHTYCISQPDLECWEEGCKIQNCLGVKRGSEINFQSSRVEGNFKEKVELDFDNLIPNLDYKNYECNLIHEINNLSFLEGDKFTLDDNLIKEFNNIYFTPQKMTQSVQTDNIEVQTSLINDNDTIDTIFEIILIETKIPKKILNKIKSVFKRKGIFSARILRLFKTKTKSLNFLVDEYKNRYPQIEGVALYLDSIL